MTFASIPFRQIDDSESQANSDPPRSMTARLRFTAAGFAYPSLSGKLLARRIVTSTASTSTDWQLSKRIKPVEGLPLSSPLSSQQRRSARPTVLHEQVALTAVALPEWPGLQVWRDSEVDNRRVWGEKGAVPVVMTCWGFC